MNTENMNDKSENALVKLAKQLAMIADCPAEEYWEDKICFEPEGGCEMLCGTEGRGQEDGAWLCWKDWALLEET